MKRARSVPELAAEKVAAWRVGRQLLRETDRARSPEAVAAALVGVQAQVLSSAGLSIAIRSGDVVGATTKALHDRRLVRSWAMRGTLHLFAAEDYPTVIAAISPGEPWRRPAWLRWFGVTDSEMDSAIDMVGEILDDGIPRTRAEIREELVQRLGPGYATLLRSSWGSFLNLATNRGYLCHATGDDGAVRFAHPRRWLGTWRHEDPSAALAKLLEQYLAAYGPASLREITRWWGVANQRDLAPTIDGLGDRLTTVEVAGERGYIRMDDLASIEAAEPRTDSVQLLGAFDPLIVGAGQRGQLIPKGHLKRVSRTSGWISPVLLIDGRVAGIWDHKREGDRLGITVEAFRPLSRIQRSGVEPAAAAVGRALGAVASVAYGPVFPAIDRVAHLPA